MIDQNNNDDADLERYLRLCQRIFLRMKRDGSWPWPDSQESEGMVDSEDHTNDV